MSDLEKLKKQRTIARGHLTRARGSLEKIMASEYDALDLEEGMHELTKNIDKLEEIQFAVEMLLDESELMASQEESAVIVEKARHVRRSANRLLQKLLNEQKSEADSVGAESNSSNTKAAAVRLPKLELPSFSGNVMEWQPFWDQFKAAIDESSLPEVSKFSYLRSLLKGEAKLCVDGLSLTGEHYKLACKMLKERYGRSEQIIFAHVQSLLCLSLKSKGSRTDALRALQDELLQHIRSLEIYGIAGDSYGIFLTPVILSRLPDDIRMEWARNCEKKESNLDYLLKVLNDEINRREKSDSFKPVTHVDVVQQERKKGSVKSSAAALQVASVKTCGICDGDHKPHKCADFLKLAVEDRVGQIKENGLCFRCLSSTHFAKKCRQRCQGCKGNHHQLICPKAGAQSADKVVKLTRGTSSPNPNNAPQPVVQTHETQCNTVQQNSTVQSNVTQCSNVQQKQAILQTVRAQVKGPRETVEATIILDGGSDRTYISHALVNRLGLAYSDSIELKYAVFGGGQSDPCVRGIYNFELSCINDITMSSNVSVSGIDVPVICSALSRPRVPEKYLRSLESQGVTLHDPMKEGQLKIDILIGQDYYWQIVKDRVVRIPSTGLVAQETVLGWILSGSVNVPVGESQRSVAMSSLQLLCLNDLSDNVVRNLWDLDSIGIKSNETVEVSPVLQEFNETIVYKDCRYEVSLPWKANGPLLKDNRLQAEQRLQGLSRKLSKDPSLKNRYDSVLLDLVNQGIVEKVSPSDEQVPYPVYYLPHRPVVKESSTSTKVRPVFDASAKGPNGVSLNDCLHTGPSLIPSLVQILIRFRRWRVALTADISKAFLQVGLRREDQDVHRFLWEIDGSVQVMRFLRVTFGNKASPFLLNGTIKHHLSKYEPTRVVEELKQNLYVDDWLSGANSEEEAYSMFEEAVSIMKSAGMQLAKWSSNSKVFSENTCAETYESFNTSEEVKVLGARWVPSLDSFTFDGATLPVITTTKRLVLSLIARTFDPLGFITPFLMKAKCLFQRLWLLGLDWDEDVPDDLEKEFSKWVDGLSVLRDLKIPRCYGECSWTDSSVIELHTFGDASEVGYGAVVYVRILQSNGTYSSSLVISKARVAPLKRVTLPRLELLGSLLAARLLIFTRDALNLPEETRYYCWSDSMAALGWIRGDPSRWKPFVGNRVQEIQNLTNPANWHHCPGCQNPADLTTRGIDAQTLLTSDLWFKGPVWLSGSEENFPSVISEPAENVSAVETSEVLLSESVDTATHTVQDKLFDVERWSSFTKAMRVVAWVMRFLVNVRCRTARRSGDLSQEELAQSKVVLLKHSQEEAFREEICLLKKGAPLPKRSPLAKLTPFIDQEGLLRVEGRLQLSELSYAERHPIILPRDHTSKLLVRFQHLLLKHAGPALLLTSLRSMYWIIGLRRLIKSVKHECLSCLRQDSKPCCQVSAPLPELRVSQSPPFTVVGVDYAGPIYCLDMPGKKMYICLFTCAVVRAVHLEITDSLSTHNFILAFKRFAARRGLPTVIYSDNAKTFQASQQQLQEIYGPLSPTWKFIAPRAPWWGGWWERLVRSVKVALRRDLGKSCLTKVELETTLLEVENCVNSRPLTFVGDEVQCSEPLTPNHFLTGKRLGFHGAVIEDTESVTTELLRDKVHASHLDLFWNRWRTEYLRNLPPFVPKFKEKGCLQEGSVVLIQEDNVPRLRWDMGIVVELFPGGDRKVRSVKLKTPKGFKVRPINRLHLLEFLTVIPKGGLDFDECGETDNVNLNDDLPKAQNSVKTRAGRVVKPVTRLDLLTLIATL